MFVYMCVCAGWAKNHWIFLNFLVSGASLLGKPSLSPSLLLFPPAGPERIVAVVTRVNYRTRAVDSVALFRHVRAKGVFALCRYFDLMAIGICARLIYPGCRIYCVINVRLVLRRAGLN